MDPSSGRPVHRRSIFGGSQLSAQEDVVRTIKATGYSRLPEPVQLGSGEWSVDFIDGKRPFGNGADLEQACRVMLALVDGVEFNAVGGLTLGADQFAHMIAVIARRKWFVVRKVAKGRGPNRRVEGTNIHDGVKVLLVDGVVSTGSSIREAYDVVKELGATVTGAITLVDRGEIAKRMFNRERIPYFAVATYKDLGIEPVRGGLVNT